MGGLIATEGDGKGEIGVVGLRNCYMAKKSTASGNQSLWRLSEASGGRGRGSPEIPFAWFFIDKIKLKLALALDRRRDFRKGPEKIKWARVS